MFKLRIIPCLDVKDGQVVKGVQFQNHEIIGDIVELAQYYCDQGADELVFYDITASSDGRVVDKSWIEKIAQKINIPFCVAGGIRSIAQAELILSSGADKISINSPALENPDLITQLARRFGSQCVVIGVDTKFDHGDYVVYQYTGDVVKTQKTLHKTRDWVQICADMGAGEIVLNCMNQDGMRQGYDIQQIAPICENISLPIIASGGAGSMADFVQLFTQTGATGALAASVFHKNTILIPELKIHLKNQGIAVRL